MKAFSTAVALIAGVSATDLCPESNQLDAAITTVLNGEMCSEICPCPIEAQSLYANIEGDFTFLKSGKSFTTFNQCWTDRLATSGQYSEDFVA
jgi:hypothetical protein